MAVAFDSQFGFHSLNERNRMDASDWFMSPANPVGPLGSPVQDATISHPSQPAGQQALPADRPLTGMEIGWFVLVIIVFGTAVIRFMDRMEKNENA